MNIHQDSWKAKAEAKVAETNLKISDEWRLNQSSLGKAKQIKNLCGPFIESFLNDEELSIIRNDSTMLVEKVKTGEYTALQVAQAFCKTAAIAHQIVNMISHSLFPSSLVLFLAACYYPRIQLPTIAYPSLYRTIVFTKSFSSRLCSEQRS